MRFMTAGGGDKQRAGYTSRVLGITETDGMDESGSESREADKIEQLEGRTLAYGSAKRIYLECTLSIETGRINQEITNGTNSRIARPCPYCGQYVSPEREHLVGWAEAESELEAADKAHWICPECVHPWTEEDRHEAAASST
jgi:phage terminase large subunit GpA-like protein